MKTNAGKYVEKVETLLITSRNEMYCIHYGNQCAGSSRKLKIDLPYSILLLGVYQRNLRQQPQRSVCTDISVCYGLLCSPQVRRAVAIG